MRQGMFTLSGAPSTTSNFGYLHLVHFHYLGSLLNYCFFYIMRRLYIYDVYKLLFYYIYAKGLVK